MSTLDRNFREHLAQTSPFPLALDIVRALETDIDSGKLAPGDRLPTQRDLAEKIKVALGTVTRAYSLARNKGLSQEQSVGEPSSRVDRNSAGILSISVATSFTAISATVA